MNIESSRLYQLLNTNIETPIQHFEQLLVSATAISVPAETVLMRVNQLSPYFYVIDVGLVRAVFVTDDGKEFSKEFHWEGDVVFGMRGLITNRPIPYSIITVEPCELLQIPLKNYRMLVEQFTSWKNYHIRQVETHLLHKEIKEELLLLNPNEQKVAQVYRSFPDLVKRVPAHLIASYLGLSPVSLSRIKKRLNLS